MDSAAKNIIHHLCVVVLGKPWLSYLPVCGGKEVGRFKVGSYSSPTFHSVIFIRNVVKSSVLAIYTN